MAEHQEAELRQAWGRSLERAREARGLSQRQLAALCGIRQPTVSRIEAGERFPSERMKNLLAGALRLSVPELFPYSPVAPPFPEQVAS